MRIDVARSFGYKDGSAITQILKRLEGQFENQSLFAARIAEPKSEVEAALSGVKS